MKKITLRFSAAVMAALFLFACQKEMSKTDAVVISQSNSTPSLARVAVSPPACGMLRTQTQGGWGAPPNGNNPGAYLHANFQAAFGNSLTVGCAPNNYYVKLTSAQAVTDLLPTGGSGASLTANYVNPASIKNVLVGQLVALKLSVGFDAWDANFGQSNVALGDMIIGSGTFQGKTVSEFLAIAEKVLGGCSSAYSVQDVLSTADSINQNFDNGTSNNGFLVCPDDSNSSEPPSAIAA